ncbi:MAG: hypothetical protein IIA65_09965, partial [Planctomycetes bacterium]|nr:hypothetical protein [Planctomycetota bacterium]
MKQASPNKTLCLVQWTQWVQLALVLTVGTLVPAHGQERETETDPPSLRIFLRPEVKITNALLRLGDIALVRG